MAYMLTVDKLDDDGRITVRHIFFGETKGECESLRDKHGAGCKAFGPALEHGSVIEDFEEIDDVPEWSDDDDE